MKKIIAAILMLSSSITMAGSYNAVISCGFGGFQNANLLACFLNSDLKITKDGRVQLYKVHDISRAGYMAGDGLHIELPENFTIEAQNSHAQLVLGIKITDQSNKNVYEDQVGRWGVISVGN